MRFGVLGPLIVSSDTGELALPAAKPRAVLVRLLADANRVVPVDRLVEDLWDGAPPPSAAQTLQTYISQLRKAIGDDRIITAAGGYRVAVSDGELDVYRFESALRAGRDAADRGESVEAAALFRQALAEWRGNALSDVAGSAWALSESARVEELRLSATEALLEAQLALGKAGDVVADAERAVSEHPLREQLWSCLIRAYYQQGRQADALRAYQRLRHHLGEELGIEPSPELRELEAAVLAQDLPRRAHVAAKASTAGADVLPDGTVTFLFSDIENSSRLWEDNPESMKKALAHHDELLRGLTVRAGGYVVKTTGDGMLAAFADPVVALTAASEIQRSVTEQLPFRVRVALHTGGAEQRDGDYFGPTLNRCARLLEIGHGGQVLVSHSTEQLVGDRLDHQVALRDLGECRLRDLSRPERVFQLVAPGLRTDFPRLASLDTAPTNLPVQLSTFIGRSSELEAVAGLLKQHRMVTLTGTGGVGKTRLALQAAADLLGSNRDGVWLIELAASDGQRLVEVVARALGVDPQPGRAYEDCLVEAIRPRQMLIILDNCEHIVREVRRLAELLLREGPELSVLATSREGLRVPGEQLFSVPSLDDDSALTLFVERASAVDSTFALDDDLRTAAHGLCRRLDGIPLAIELAAARVSLFSVEDLADRLKERFRLLTGGRGAVERHQTLRAAIDWSFELLDASERAALCRLSVFAGGWTLDAAEAVLSDDDLAPEDVLDLLASLVDKSLVIVDRTQSRTRYDLLETIRQYAEQRLVESGDAEAVRARHARWYAAFARAAGRGLYSPDEALWATRLALELDNLQVAVSWAVAAGETDVAMRIGGSFPRQGMSRPLLGTTGLAEHAISVVGAENHPLRARVMAEAGWAEILRGNLSGGKTLLHASVDAQKDGARYAAAAYTYLLPLYHWDEVDAHYRLATEGLDAAEAAGDRLGEIGCRASVAIYCELTGRDGGFEHATLALRQAQDLRQPTLVAAALYAKAIALSDEDPISSIELLHQSIDLAKSLGTEFERLSALGMLAALEARRGRAVEALEALREQLLGIQGPANAFDHHLFLTAEVLTRNGRPDLALKCCAFWPRGSPPPLYARYNEPAVESAKAALGQAESDRLMLEAAAMSPAELRAFLLREVDELLATASNDQSRG